MGKIQGVEHSIHACEARTLMHLSCLQSRGLTYIHHKLTSGHHHKILQASPWSDPKLLWTHSSSRAPPTVGGGGSSFLETSDFSFSFHFISCCRTPGVSLCSSLRLGHRGLSTTRLAFIGSLEKLPPCDPLIPSLKSPHDKLSTHPFLCLSAVHRGLLWILGLCRVH